MNHEPLDRLHLQQIAAAYAAGDIVWPGRSWPTIRNTTPSHNATGNSAVVRIDRWATEGLIEIIKDGPAIVSAVCWRNV